LPPSAFLIDASLTLLGRMRRGERWWEPHALHAYQKWAQRRGSHVAVTWTYAAWTCIAIILMNVLSAAPFTMAGVIVVVASWYTTGAGIWFLLQKPSDKGVPR
jgi:hypothetical protein